VNPNIFYGAFHGPIIFWLAPTGPRFKIDFRINIQIRKQYKHVQKKSKKIRKLHETKSRFLTMFYKLLIYFSEGVSSNL